MNNNKNNVDYNVDYNVLCIMYMYVCILLIHSCNFHLRKKIFYLVT